MIVVDFLDAFDALGGVAGLNTGLILFAQSGNRQAEQVAAIREWANVRAVSATAEEDRADYVGEPADTPSVVAKEKEEKSDIFEKRGGRTIDI